MAWFRRSAPTCRLFLLRADGRELRRELPPRALEWLIRRILEQGGDAAAKSWERSAQFSAAAVLGAWPAGLPRPERALLGGADAARGPWLEAVFGPGAPLQEIAEDLERALLEQKPLARIQAEPVAGEAPAARPAPARPAAPRAGPAAAPAPAPRAQTQSQAQAPSSAGTLPVLRRATAPPALEEGLFAGMAEDLLDAGVEVRPADLPGLDRGDRVQSPRRGSCSILDPAAAPGIMLLRDERGREIQISHAELTAEFSFDDPPDEPPAV